MRRVLVIGVSVALLTVSACTAGDDSPASGRTPTPPGPWTQEQAATALADMELTVTPPTTYFAAVESALSDHGVRPLTVLRWSGGGNELQGVGYLPHLGSGITVLTTHLMDGSGVGWDPCTLLPGSTSEVLVDPPAGTCATESAADGSLVTVDNHAAPTAPRDARTEPLDTAATQAVLVTASSVVSVTTWAMDIPAASAVADRRPVDVEIVQALAQDPRLRW